MNIKIDNKNIAAFAAENQALIEIAAAALITAFDMSECGGTRRSLSRPMRLPRSTRSLTDAQLSV